MHGMIVLYARYSRGPMQENRLTDLNISYYRWLVPMGEVWRAEHIAYDPVTLPFPAIEAGDRILKIGHVKLSTVVKAAYHKRSLKRDIRYAKKMVLQKSLTGEIFEVNLAHRLDTPRIPYVKVEMLLRQFRKPRFVVGKMYGSAK